MLHRTPGRRATDALPDDYATARSVIEMRLAGLEDGVVTLTDRISAMADDMHSIAGTVQVMKDRQGWMLAVVAVVFTGFVSAGFYVSTRVILTALDGRATAAQESRIEQIADVLEQSSLPRNRDGTPRLSALQSELPTVPGISRQERAAACLRVPGACLTP